jgi:murein DD-endopeptidase MepM/ murein hydrolase activator NlpD
VGLPGCASFQRSGSGTSLEHELQKTLGILYELNSEDEEWATSDIPLPFRWPLSRATLTSPFGWRSGRPHHGLDLAAPEETPILAALGGVVVYADDRITGYGHTLMIRHVRGYSSVYAHCSRLFVQKGDRVIQGQRIAAVGETGRASAPHLHFEVRAGLKAVDPLEFLPPTSAIRRVPGRLRPQARTSARFPLGKLLSHQSTRSAPPRLRPRHAGSFPLR